jgi:hypothetical protein
MDDSSFDDDIPDPSEPEEAFVGHDGPTEPLTAEERESVEADLEDLASMQDVFAPQGAKGVVISCADCGENHYYGWDLLKENLDHMLETGEPRMHEPAYEPREDEYVVWDYGKGYVDALSDAGLDPSRRIDLTSCPWCDGVVDPAFDYCPACGRSLAPLRLYRELTGRGMPEQEALTLLVQAGFEPFS